MVVIPVEDFNSLTGALNQLKAAIIYSPLMADSTKVQQQQAIDVYLRDLPKRIRVEDVKSEVKKSN